MTKRQRNMLMVVAVIMLLYFWWSNQASTQKSGNGSGYQAPPRPPQPPTPQPPNKRCTNTCCSASGTPVVPANYPTCKCPTSNYVYVNGQCSLSGVLGCMDAKATNFNPIATISDPTSCLYGQQTRDCFSNCVGQAYNTINTADACGTGSATNYPYTTAPFCGGNINPTPSPQNPNNPVYPVMG
jgi:hypothetical protein